MTETNNLNETESETEEWNKCMFYYQAALKEVGTKIDILSAEFTQVHMYNPIEHVKTRIKEKNSIRPLHRAAAGYCSY